MIETHCAFCGNDPYEYVDIGVGMDRVAVTCCELGCAVYDHRHDDDAMISLTVKELREISGNIFDLRWQVVRRDKIIEKLFYHRKRPGAK